MFNAKGEKEMKEIANKYSDSIMIREYDNGSSHDYRRESTPEEKNIISSTFFSAMWSINFRRQQVNGNVIQTVLDMAEMTVQNLIRSCNAYDTIYLPLEKEIDKWQKESRMFDIDHSTLLAYKAIGDRVISIPEGVERIGNFAFEREYPPILAEEMFIPDSVKEIGNWAFTGCKDLTEIKIPDSVKSIGNSAFYDCCSLRWAKLPDGLEVVESSTFYGCSALESVEIPDSVREIEEYAFDHCGNFTIICNEGSYAEQYAKEHDISYAYPNERAKRKVEETYHER